MVNFDLVPSKIFIVINPTKKTILHKIQSKRKKSCPHLCKPVWKESKKAGLEINSSKTEEIRVNTTVKQRLRLNGEDIKRLSDFCYLGSTVAKNGGTSREVSARIQKVRGSLSKSRRVWLSKSLRKDTEIRIFNACVKSVLLYGCETWLVT